MGRAKHFMGGRVANLQPRKLLRVNGEKIPLERIDIEDFSPRGGGGVFFLVRNPFERRKMPALALSTGGVQIPQSLKVILTA